MNLFSSDPNVGYIFLYFFFFTDKSSTPNYLCIINTIIRFEKVTDLFSSFNLHVITSEILTFSGRFVPPILPCSF